MNASGLELNFKDPGNEAHEDVADGDGEQTEGDESVDDGGSKVLDLGTSDAVKLGAYNTALATSKRLAMTTLTLETWVYPNLGGVLLIADLMREILTESTMRYANRIA